MPSNPEPQCPEPDSPSQRVVILAQLGDRAALESLLVQTRPWLMRCLSAMLGHPDGEDATQDVMYTIARRLVTLDEPRAYRAWVYRVATRHAFRVLSRQRRHASIEDTASTFHAPAPETTTAPGADELSRLRHEISRLSSNSLAVVVLHYFEGLSIARVAGVLGVPEGTAKSRLHSALAALRRTLAKEPPC